MDWVSIRVKLQESFGKYKYGLLILALGLLLMWLPDRNMQISEVTTETVAPVQTDLETKLEQVLGQIDGVGKVRVLLTEAAGEEIYYQTDDDGSVSNDSESKRTDTVIIKDDDGGETGLVRQINPPLYLGAIVVCEGADRSSVCLAVVQAVSDVTGLGSDRISVLKMK